jgi:hypothetical protein
LNEFADNPYQRNGVAKYLKTPLEKTFKPLKTILLDITQDGTIDDNLSMHDFEKMQNVQWAAISYKVLGSTPTITVDSFKQKCFEASEKELDGED